MTPSSTLTVADVVAAMDGLYAPRWKASWDCVGLICGDPATTVRHIHFAVDPVAEVVAEAIEAGADMLITHHPLYLRGTSSVAATTPKGRVVHRLITHGVALFNAHTNADVAKPGVADALAELMGLVDTRPLDREHADAPPQVGTGRVGTLPTPVRLQEFATQLSRVLPAAPVGIRVSGNPEREIRTVALCGGAGDSLLAKATAAGADVYVTADLRHHPASEARGDEAEQAPALIDAGHWATEWPWLPQAAQRLTHHFAPQGANLTTTISTLVTDPWTSVLLSDEPAEGVFR